MGSLRDAGIVKEAGLGSALGRAWKSLPARATRGVLGKGLGVGFGAMFGSELFSHAREIADKTPVGFESKARWQADVARAHANSAPDSQIRKAQSNVRKGGLLGALAGAVGTVPIAFARGKKNWLLPVISGIAGKLVGEGIARRKNPLATPQGSLMDSTMNQYAGLFSPDERQQLLAVRNNPEVAADPKIQNHLNQLLQAKVRQHPDFYKYEAKKKKFSTMGKIFGGGAVLAAMVLGRKKLPKHIIQMMRSGQINPKVLNKKWVASLGKFVEQSPVRKGLLGYGGFMSGDPMKAWIPMALGATALGGAGSYIAAKRARLTPEEVSRNVSSNLLSANTAMDLAFYGNPAIRASRLAKVLK